MVRRSKVDQAVTYIHLSRHGFLVSRRSIVIPFVATWNNSRCTICFGVFAQRIQHLDLTVWARVTAMVRNIIPMERLCSLTRHDHDRLGQ
ncbi:hypothetical protein D3C85_1616530 [compost metagenome]